MARRARGMESQPAGGAAAAAHLALPDAAPPEGVAEDAWMEVILKMDEVYSDLLQYEVALEEKNAALEDSQKFIFSVLTSMSDILAVCDRHGRIQQVNAAFARLVGRGEEELHGALISDLFADEVSRRQAEGFMREMSRENLHDCEMQFRAADGSTMPVAVNCKPRLSPTGKFVGTDITGRPIGDLRRDYTALRQAHENLKRTQQQLVHSEKMASLGRLVATLTTADITSLAATSAALLAPSLFELVLMKSPAPSVAQALSEPNKKMSPRPRPVCTPRTDSRLMPTATCTLPSAQTTLCEGCVAGLISPS